MSFKMRYRMYRLKKTRNKLISYYTKELKVIVLALSEIGIPKNDEEVKILKKYIELYEKEDSEFRENFLNRFKSYLNIYSNDQEEK